MGFFKYIFVCVRICVRACVFLCLLSDDRHRWQGRNASYLLVMQRQFIFAPVAPPRRTDRDITEIHRKINDAKIDKGVKTKPDREIWLCFYICKQLTVGVLWWLLIGQILRRGESLCVIWIWVFESEDTTCWQSDGSVWFTRLIANTTLSIWGFTGRNVL